MTAGHRIKNLKITTIRDNEHKCFMKQYVDNNNDDDDDVDAGL